MIEIVSRFPGLRTTVTGLSLREILNFRPTLCENAPYLSLRRPTTTHMICVPITVPMFKIVLASNPRHMVRRITTTDRRRGGYQKCGAAWTERNERRALRAYKWYEQSELTELG